MNLLESASTGTGISFRVDLLTGRLSILKLHLASPTGKKTTAWAVVSDAGLWFHITSRNLFSYLCTSFFLLHTNYHQKTTAWAAYIGPGLIKISKSVILMESSRVTEEIFKLKTIAGTSSLSRKINC